MAIYWDKQVVGFLPAELYMMKLEYLSMDNDWSAVPRKRLWSKVLEVLIKEAQMDRACSHIPDYRVGNENEVPVD